MGTEVHVPPAVNGCAGCAGKRGSRLFISTSGSPAHARKGHYACREHMTTRERNRVERVRSRAIKLGLGGSCHTDGVCWPYGPNINLCAREALVDWMERENLQPANGPTHHHCLRWVKLGYCKKFTCDQKLSHDEMFMDHVTYWRGAGRNSSRRVLVTQPYMKVQDVVNETLLLTLEDNVHVEVHDRSWYGFGTTFIGLWGG